MDEEGDHGYDVPYDGEAFFRFEGLVATASGREW